MCQICPETKPAFLYRYGSTVTDLHIHTGKYVGLWTSLIICYKVWSAVLLSQEHRPHFFLNYRHYINFKGSMHEITLNQYLKEFFFYKVIQVFIWGVCINVCCLGNQFLANASYTAWRVCASPTTRLLLPDTVTHHTLQVQNHNVFAVKLCNHRNLFQITQRRLESLGHCVHGTVCVRTTSEGQEGSPRRGLIRAQKQQHKSSYCSTHSHTHIKVPDCYTLIKGACFLPLICTFQLQL